MKKFFSLMLALAMCCSLAAPVFAANQSYKEDAISPYYYDDHKDSKHETVSAGKYSYDCYSTLHYGSTATKGSVWAVEENRTDVLASVKAYVYENGQVKAESGWKTDTAYIHFADTPITRLSGKLKADGQYKLYHNGENGPHTDGWFPAAEITYNASKAVDTENETIVTEYPVNQKGETYGSYLDRKTAGGAPDLISAIGVDGTQGYVRRDDFAPELNSLKEVEMWQDQVDENNLIPLYDLNGTVIGQYALGTRSEQEELDPQILQRIEELGGDSASFAARYAATREPMEELYPVNEKGESYGSYSDRLEKGYAPQLISIIGDNGKHGYVYRQQFRMREKDSSLDVYDLNGNIIDSYSSIGLEEEIQP